MPGQARGGLSRWRVRVTVKRNKTGPTGIEKVSARSCTCLNARTCPGAGNTASCGYAGVSGLPLLYLLYCEAVYLQGKLRRLEWV